MPIATLFRQGFDRYVAEEADPGDRLWVFIHIPKTAGSSFRDELGRRLSPEYHLKVDYVSDRPLPAQRLAAVEACLEANRRQRLRFVSGHVQYQHLRRLAVDEPRTRFITILRDPVSRVVSDFYYQRTPAHPLCEEFKQRFPTLEDFARFEPGQNKMTKFLRINRNEQAIDVASRMLREFSFVGLQDDYNLSFRLMTRLLLRSSTPEAHLRRGDGRPEISGETLSLIRALNTEDVVLFETFQRRFATVASAVRAGLAAEGANPVSVAGAKT